MAEELNFQFTYFWLISTWAHTTPALNVAFAFQHLQSDSPPYTGRKKALPVQTGREAAGRGSTSVPRAPDKVPSSGPERAAISPAPSELTTPCTTHGPATLQENALRRVYFQRHRGDRTPRAPPCTQRWSRTGRPSRVRGPQTVEGSPDRGAITSGQKTGRSSRTSYSPPTRKL